MRVAYQTIFLAALIIQCGCSLPYINVDDVPGTSSPDGKYSLHVVGVNQGHPLFDKSKKSVRIYIGILGVTDPKNQDCFFNYSYIFKGSDIRWTTQWASSEKVSVQFYSVDSETNNYSGLNLTNNYVTTSNYIASLLFILDKDKFLEQK
jgi:hypothetical protein